MSELGVVVSVTQRGHVQSNDPGIFPSLNPDGAPEPGSGLWANVGKDI